MATILSAADLAGVKFSGNGRMNRQQWEAEVRSLVATGEIYANLEEDYPSVKPAHVHHMFRIIIRDEKLNARVALTDDYGVVLAPAA
jgi:hypothetical protein